MLKIMQNTSYILERTVDLHKKAQNALFEEQSLSWKFLLFSIIFSG